jgi:hypothetical protein
MNIDLNDITIIFRLMLTFVIFKYINTYGGIIHE